MEYKTVDFQPFVDGVVSSAQDMSKIFQGCFIAAEGGYGKTKDTVNTHIKDGKKLIDSLLGRDDDDDDDDGGGGDDDDDDGDLPGDGDEDIIDDNGGGSDIKLPGMDSDHDDEIHQSPLAAASEINMDDPSPVAEDTEEIVFTSIKEVKKSEKKASDKINEGETPAPPPGNSGRLDQNDDTIIQITVKELKELYKDFTDVEKEMNDFRPGSYLTSEARQSAASLAQNNVTLANNARADLEKAQEKHFEQVNEAYTKYNEHVGELRQSVYEAFSSEYDQVNAAKSAFLEAGKTISDENRSLIADFVGKMPNSRNGQVVNQTVAEFIASPVSVVHADARSETSKDAPGYDWRLVLVLLACFIIILFSLGNRVARSIRRNKSS